MLVRVTVAGRVGIEAGGVHTGEAGLGRLGRLALAYLMCERHRPVVRDELADVLWGDDLPASWEQLLRGLTSKMRATLSHAGLDPATSLTSALGAYQIHLPAGAVVDVEEAAEALEAAAAALATGDYAGARSLASGAVTVASRQFLPAATGAWVERRQAELRELHLRALEVVARAATADGLWGDAIDGAEEAIAIEPFRESAYLALMDAHAGAGSRGEAIRAYERCRRVLAEELGVAPSPQTEAAFLALLGDEPVTVPEATPVPLPAALQGLPGGFLVGREAESERLDDAFKRTGVEGRQAVFVGGEPGIGKSTLVAAFARDAHLQGARVLYGRCDEELGLSYQPFAEALSGFIANAPQHELATHVAAHGGELSRLAPELTQRLPDTPVPPVTDPEADRYRLFGAITSLLTNAAAGGPLVLILEDLHWAAPPTLVLLRQLLRSTVAAPVVLIGTYRHTDIGPDHPLTQALADLHREPAVDRLVLGGLDQDGVASFVRASGAGEASGDDVALVSALHVQTSGNPFFVGQLLRHLGETGATYRRGGTWTYYAGTEGLGIPDGVREVVGRRLHRLSEPARDALRWGSVIGTEFSLDVLGRVGGQGHTDAMLDAVDEAVGAHLVVERGSGRYGFAHALVRDAIYADLTLTRRAQWHRRVAEALGALPIDDAHRLPALVHHFAAAATAGGATKAADHAMAAARQTFAQSAWEDAVAFLERGLEALAADETPDLQRRCDLLLMLAETWCRFWNIDRALSAATEAVATARSLDNSERLASAARWYLTAEQRPEFRLKVAEEALTALGDDRPDLRAIILARVASATGPAEVTSAEALELARRSGSAEALGVALMVRSQSLGGTERAGERLAVAEELVSSASPGGWDGWRGGYQERACARIVMGDRAGFEADAAECERMGRERRFWFYRGRAALWRVTSALLDGRFDAVEALADEFRELEAAATGKAVLHEVRGIQLGRLFLDRGRLLDAASAVRPILDRHPTHPVLAPMLASVHAQLGEVEAAAQELDRCAAGDFRTLAHLKPAGLAYLTEVAVHLGDTENAVGIYDHLVPYARQMVAAGPVAHCPGSVDRYLGQLAAMLDRTELAESHFKVALRMEDGMRSPPLLARTQVWYAHMLRERGTPADIARARELLRASQETSDRLGMAGLAHQAEELMTQL